jgi:hypothetical protein
VGGGGGGGLGGKKKPTLAGDATGAGPIGEGGGLGAGGGGGSGGLGIRLGGGLGGSLGGSGGASNSSGKMFSTGRPAAIARVWLYSGSNAHWGHVAFPETLLGIWLMYCQ